MTSLTFPPGPSRSMVGTTSTSPCGAGPGVLKSLRGSGADLFGNTAGGRGTEHAAYVEAAVVVDDVILTHIEDLGERCAQTVRLHQDVVAASAPNRDDVVAQSIRGTLPPPVDEIGPGHLCTVVRGASSVSCAKVVVCAPAHFGVAVRTLSAQVRTRDDPRLTSFDAQHPQRGPRDR